MDSPPRLAVRGILMVDQRLLLVNAFAAHPDILWCLPGGGVEAGASLPDNLKREIYEEAGLHVRINAPALINEFHDPATGFHQVEIVFHTTLLQGKLRPDWQDPEGVVSVARLFTRAEVQDLPLKPSILKTLPWESTELTYDPLEIMIEPGP